MSPTRAAAKYFAYQGEKGGKRIVIRPESDLLKQRQALMATEEFKLDMHKRNGIEGTLSGLVRGNGMRRSRYRGKSKTELHIKLCGAAANISRLQRKRNLDASSASKMAHNKIINLRRPTLFSLLFFVRDPHARCAGSG